MNKPEVLSPEYTRGFLVTNARDIGGQWKARGLYERDELYMATGELLEQLAAFIESNRSK